MKRLLFACALLVVAGLVPLRAGAAFIDVCCACITKAPRARTSQALQPTDALFCAEATDDPAQSLPLEERCADLGSDNELLCVPHNPGRSCAQQLLDGQDILCPEVGAPVAGAPGLMALAVVLSGLGAWAVRRRVRR